MIVEILKHYLKSYKLIENKKKFFIKMISIDIYSLGKSIQCIELDDDLDFYDLENSLNEQYEIIRIICYCITVSKSVYSIRLLEYSKNEEIKVLVA